MGKAVGRSKEIIIGSGFLSINLNVSFEVFHRTLKQDDNIILAFWHFHFVCFNQTTGKM